VYRTVYGKAVLRSPRSYSRCSGCGFVSGDGAPFPLLACRWLFRSMRGPSRRARRPTANAGSSSWPRSLSGAARSGYAHACALGLGRRQGMRQQAFLQSIGVPRQSPITVLSDGGDDISHACKLPAATARVLDWFHIGMRVEQLLLSLRGLRVRTHTRNIACKGDVIVAKWLLWNGRKERCFEELEALRRETGWVGAHNPLGGLIRYLRGCSALLVNYARRRALNLPVSSAGPESAVDHVIGQRLKRNGHMRWTREGANSLLQVRCAVLNGLDVRNFMRWYPPGKQFAPLPRARLLS